MRVGRTVPEGFDKWSFWSSSRLLVFPGRSQYVYVLHELTMLSGECFVMGKGPGVTRIPSSSFHVVRVPCSLLVKVTSFLFSFFFLGSPEKRSPFLRLVKFPVLLRGRVFVVVYDLFHNYGISPLCPYNSFGVLGSLFLVTF